MGVLLMVQSNSVASMHDYDHLKKAFGAFVAARDWRQFHTPKNTAICLAVEAGELLELYTWVDDASPGTRPGTEQPKQARVEDEVADVFLSLLSFCDAAGVDPLQAARAKLVRLDQKYPLEISRGSAVKNPTISQ